MTSTTQDVATLARSQPASKATPAVVDDGAIPTGLKVILFAIVTLAMTITYVVYLASQMPT